MANTTYNSALEALAKAQVDMVNADLRMMLIQSGYVVNKDHRYVTDVVASEVTVTGYTRILIVLGDRMHNRIPTPQLNRFLAEIVQERQPPAKQGHRLKLLYMTQFQTSPPRFSVQVNSRSRVTRDYAYFIENRLRARFGMDGVPVIIDFHERKSRRSER